MRKIILNVAVSLDGFIEGSKGEYDWCPPPAEDDVEMNAFLNRIDTIFIGRKSFALFDPKYFPGKKAIVFSRSMNAQNDITVISSDFLSNVESIKKEKGKDIWLFGGADLVTSFMNENLVDEMWLAIVPVILGSGKPLFQNIEQRRHFHITKAINSKDYISAYLRKEDAKK
jgi:dihydrofolate reductase